MQITDVRGISSDDLALDSLEVEGRAPDADKVEVTVEVTGKTLSKTISVRKDETWTARFKGTGKTDLSGFACGALVSAEAVASGDQTQHVSWKGCLPCGAADGEEHGERDQAESSSETRLSSETYRSESGEPLVVVEQHASDSGDALVTVRVAESSEAVAYRTTRQDEARDRAQNQESRGDSSGRGPGTPPSRHDERPDETRLAPHPDDQDHARRDRRDDERRATQNERRDERERQEEDEGTPVWLGGLLALAEAGFLVAVTAQSYPIILGAAAAFLLAMTAFFFANEPPRSWAIWTFGGLGLAAIAIAGMLPFFEFIGFDVYLLSAGIAAAGLAAGAAFLMFASGDDDDA